MSLACDIIRDLLPLHAEGLCSQASEDLLSEHLAGCAACRAELEALRQPAVAAPEAALPLKAVRGRLRQSRLRLAALVAALLLFLSTAVLAQATRRVYAPFDDELVRVWLQEDGRLAIGNLRPAGMDVRMLEGADDPGSVAVYVIFYDVQKEGAEGYQLYALPEGKRPVVYYVYPDAPAVLLHGEARDDSGFYTLPRLALNYYLYAAAGLALLLAAPLPFMKRRPRARRTLAALAALPACYVLAHLAIKGLSGLSWDMARDLAFILAAWVFASAAALLLILRRPAQGVA